MHFYQFEQLDLQYQEGIQYQDENGFLHHGFYLGNYSRAYKTFQFRDFKDGREYTVDINSIQYIERI